MGKGHQGLYGEVRKRVGNVVGRVRLGVQVFSIYQPNVANPKTMKQQIARKRLSLMSSVAKMIGSDLKLTMSSAIGNGRTSYNVLVAENLAVSKGVITGNTLANLAVDYTKLTVGVGAVPNVYGALVELENNTLSFMWSDNTGIPLDALADDSVYTILLCPDVKQSYNVKLANREDRVGEVVLPSTWIGHRVYEYIMCLREGESGQSAYIGYHNLS